MTWEKYVLVPIVPAVPEEVLPNALSQQALALLTIVALLAQRATGVTLSLEIKSLLKPRNVERSLRSVLRENNEKRKPISGSIEAVIAHPRANALTMIYVPWKLVWMASARSPRLFVLADKNAKKATALL